MQPYSRFQNPITFRFVMFAYLKSRWELLTGLAIFIVAKIPVLNYPFYWDESWSYAPGVKLMYLHGPSLMPNAIDLFYSRGHPLLFYASAAAWMKVFGDSHIAQHSFCLLLSVLLIFLVYEVGLKFFNKKVALISLLLLPLQIMFFVQTTFLLPEVMIGLLTLMTIYFYVEEKYLFTFLSCTALMLTKESGFVLGLILGLHAILFLFNMKEPMPKRLRNFSSVFFSGVATGLYFLLQKKLNGWYFYPEHTGYIQWDWHIFWDKFRFALYLLFNFDHRTWFFRILMGLGVLCCLPFKSIRPASLLLSGACIYLAVEDRFSRLPRQVLFVLFLLSLALAAWQLVKISDNKSTKQTKFIYISVFFMSAYLVFTAINFFTARYLICLFPILIILSSAFLEVFISKFYGFVFYLSLIAIVVIGFFSFRDNKGIGDINLGAIDAMCVQEKVITWLEQNNAFEKNIAAASFQTREHLQKPFTGFLHSGKTFKNLTYGVMPNTNYIIFDNIEPDITYDTLLKNMKNSPDYELVFEVKKGEAESKVYEKKK